ncbi:MAG: hypothetical protein KJZ58_03455 [Flavobacteriales bacterium]|nr:hypothetical protein [Flavobacteriales bacterium]MCL4281301.1 hypothetical protein [Flavobacteriales bacterium]
MSTKDSDNPIRVGRKSVPTKPKRQLPDVRKFAGTIPGMDQWALEEVRRMRDEW